MTLLLASEIIVVLFWLISWYLFQRLLNRSVLRQFISPFAGRKIAHVAIGLWILPLAFLIRHWYVAALPITMILAANTKANLTRARLGRTSQRLFPLVTFAAPVALILYFWSRNRTDLVVLAVLAMSIGDTAAAIVGIRLGKHKVPWTGKTLEGAAANFIASLATLSIAGHALYQLPAGSFVLPSAAVAALEAALGGEWDNPAAIMLLLILLGYPALP
jgi:dolichol kinase